MTLRDVHWHDIGALASLEREVFPDDAWSEASWWAELAGRPRRDYVVDEDARGIVGYGGLDHAGEVSDVMTLAVAPRGRGHGRGRALLDDLISRTRARGGLHVMLEVRADNAAALRLYRDAGFVLLRRRRGYYPDGADALVMRRTLQGETDD